MTSPKTFNEETVASLELCRELYELSGWELDEKESQWWANQVSKDAPPSYVLTRPRWSSDDFPAYSAGYLLRKLPASIDEGDMLSAYLSVTKFNLADKFSAYYQVGASKPRIEVTADTPEDALCQLAIELFKRGALK